MFGWLTSLFRRNPLKTEKVVVPFKLPDGSEFKVEAVKILDYHQEKKCKVHWDYHGLSVPTNNCNDCWEYYTKKMKGFN